MKFDVDDKRKENSKFRPELVELVEYFSVKDRYLSMS